MHTARPGDTYYKISMKYGVSVEKLMELNNDADTIIFTGQPLKIRPVSNDKTVTVNVNGTFINMDLPPYIENDTVFVPVRFVAEGLGATVNWDNDNQIALIKGNGRSIKLTPGKESIIVDGQSINTGFITCIYEGRIHVPLRIIAEFLGASLDWDAASYIVSISKDTQNGDDHNFSSLYSEDDLYWLSRIVEAEAQGETFEGKLAVANVVINRKNSEEFPDTIKEVIFDPSYGYQFTPVKNGSIYNEPSADSIRAAEEALSGNNNIGCSLYFLNPVKSGYTWIQAQRELFGVIGGHHFYL